MSVPSERGFERWKQRVLTGMVSLILVAFAYVFSAIAAEYFPPIVSFLIGVLGALLLLGLAYKVAAYEPSFSDLDAPRSRPESIRAGGGGDSVVRAGKSVQAEHHMEQPIPATFENYYNGLRSALLERADTADSKASLLLDQGMRYARWGIVFYVLSIIAWQSLALHYGWKTQFIYGIASCSLLFIFIEFLSAWCLKQYRAFVDTSTYLMKVKSIFDRYMLTYLAHHDDTITAAPESPTAAALFAMLGADIKWPESYLGRDADANLAREFVSSLSELAIAVRKQNGSGGN
jgi:hypothetical protein